MRTCLLFMLILSGLTCTGCATVGGAVVEGLVNSAFSSIFGPDDDCEIDPHILKRKGIEPGSKEQRRLESHVRLQKAWQEEERREERSRQTEERRRAETEEWKSFRKINENLKSIPHYGN